MMNIMNSNDQRSSTVNSDEQWCRAMKLLGSVRKEGVPECHGQLENINTSIININTDTRSFQALKH